MNEQINKQKKSNPYRGGVQCEMEDCFANQSEKCTLLNKAWKDETRDCPWYKPGDSGDPDGESYVYGIKRIETLNKLIEEQESDIKNIMAIAAKMKNKLSKSKRQVKTAKKETKEIAERIIQRNV